MTIWEIVALRLTGGAGGSIIAVAIVQPNTLPGFFKRLLVSMTSALMLTPVLMDYLGWLQTPDNLVAASCIVAALAWWGWHAAIRIAQSDKLPWRKE